MNSFSFNGRMAFRLPILALAIFQTLGEIEVKAQTTNTIGTTTVTSASPINITAGNATLCTGTLAFTANGSSVYNAVTGAGTLILGATGNGPSSPDINFNNTDTANSTANYGTAIATTLDLGAATRYIWGRTDHNGVDKYGTLNTDCEFNGNIIGSGGLTFIAQDAYTSSSPMETPFCLNAVNTFTGPVQIQRGSVYLGAANAFPAGNVLQFSVASGNNGRFYLYGQAATVSDLSFTGAGTALIANACRTPDANAGPATLTITENNPTTFAGSLVDIQVEYVGSGGSLLPTLSVIKNGLATLTLTGTNKYSGSLAVNAGKLYMNSASSGGGVVTVNNGGTLGGSGSFSGPVVVANGGTLEAGNAGSGTLTFKGLALGTSPSDTRTLNFGSTSSGITSTFAVTSLNGFTNNGVTTISIFGALPAASPGIYTLITYSGTLKGAGTFVLGTIPNFQSTAYLINNTAASAIQLVVPGPGLVWAGSITTNWDLAGNDDWLQFGTTIPASYTDGDAVVFDDTASNFSLNLPVTVQPFSVVFSNSLNNYTFSGAGGISNTFSFSKQGSATVTVTGASLNLTNLSVNAGKLYLNTSASSSLVLVNNGGTLGGTGTISAPLIVAGGGVLEAGSAGSGLLTIKSLSLGTSASDSLTLNFTSSAAGLATSLAVTNVNGFTNNGITTINISGPLPTANPTNYTLLTYSGVLRGSGAFALGAITSFMAPAYITNNTAASAIQLVVPIQPLPTLTWVGSPTNDWDLAGNLDWVQAGTTTPFSYVDGSPVIFDDTATNFTVNLAAAVQPYSVIFSNSVNNYFLGGLGTITDGVTNPVSLTKQGGAVVTLATTNSYSGITTVAAGTLVLGVSGAIPSGPTAGNVVVNGALDLAGYSPAVNNLSGTGTVDDISAGGNPVLTVTNTATSSFTGIIQNSSGSLALNKTGAGTLGLGASNTYNGGTLIANGAVSITGSGGLGLGPVVITENAAGGVSNILTVANSAAVMVNNNLTLPNASGTYVLTKNATGPLTLNNTISGGGSGFILRTSSDTAGDTNTVFEFVGTNSFSGGLQTWRGIVQLDNPNSLGSATVYGDGNASIGGDLSFASSMTFTNPLVMQSATTVSPNANNVVMSGRISGNNSFTKYGPGLLVLAGPNTFSGTLTAAAGTLDIGSVTLAGDTTDSSQVDLVSISAGAMVQSSGTIAMDASSSLNPSICVNGVGTLQLTGTNNGPNAPDIYFNATDVPNSTDNWGTRIATPLDLGNVQRYIWGNTEHSGVDVYGVTEADCQFEGAISGAGGLTFIAQDSFTGSNPMETPFCFNAVNSFTGPVQIQRGSLYLGVANAYPAGNVLQFNVAAGNFGKFFLHGENATISDLSSSGAGTAVIADGNRNPSSIGPATLTIIQNNPGTFAGSIVDTNLEYPGSAVGSHTVLSVTKAGLATLILSGNHSFSGPLAVNAGSLYINGLSSGGGLVTVSNGATLGGNGTITSAVTISNNATLEAGGGAGLGILSVNSLALGTSGSDVVTLNCDANPAGINSVSVQSANGFTNNATVTVNIAGVMPASQPAVYTLIAYVGSVQGNGSFILGSVPDQAVAYVTNNTGASAIQLVVSSVIIPSVTWTGSPTNDWDLLGGDIWVQTGSSTPAAYANNDQVIFDDTASNFFVNLAATVAPDGVLFSNNVNAYVVAGSGSISGYTSVTKLGTGTVTMIASNNYSGSTTIATGTMALNAPGAIPGGPGAGNVTVNGTLDMGGSSPTLNNLSGAGVVDNISAGGSPILTLLNSTASVFAGIIQNTSGSLELNKIGSGTLTLGGNSTYSGLTIVDNGTLQVGNGSTSGSLGAGMVLDMGTLAFNRSDVVTVSNSIAGAGGLQQNGAGTVTMAGNLTYAGPTLVNAGTLIFPNDVTFDSAAGATLTVASNAIAETGFEIFLNANQSSVAVDISGAGTTRLISNLNRIESYADLVIGANNNGVSTANYGIRISSGLDLGSVERLFWATSSRDDVTTYGLNGCDCQFAGPISGTAQLQLLGKNSWPGVNTMEEQFALTASNSFTGPLEVLRGSVYLGNTNALMNGNVLILDPAASVNSRLFLYGFNASVSDLQSGGYGAIVIANGNNVTSSNVGPATLTVTENNPTTFVGNIMDWYTEYTAPHTGPLSPTLSLVKNGPATLTLSGNNSYSGTTLVNSGKLYINSSSTGGGAVIVKTNATLAGSGIVSSSVTVQNGGTIEGGSGAGVGNLQLENLALGENNGDASVLNLTPGAMLMVTNNNGLVLNGGSGTVTLNVGGDIASVGIFPLIAYSGTLGGTGFGAFQLGVTPVGVDGYLSNDTTHASIDFVATLVTTPRWTGAFSSEWSTGTIASPKNWVLDSDGVTPIDYLDGENVKFDDTASNPMVNINVANVSPASVTISNTTVAYVLGGSFGIAGQASLTKLGNGTATLSAPNSYTGNTTISTGTLALGAANAIPAGPDAGNVVLNGILDVAGFSPTLNNLSGTGTLDDVTAGGSPIVTVNETAGSTFNGVLQNTTGSLGLTVTGTGIFTLSNVETYSGPTLVSGGTLVVSGTLGTSPVTVQNGAALGGSGVINGPAALNAGAALDLTANSPLTAHAVTLAGTVTVDVSGNVSVTNSGTYTLLNFKSLNSTNLFQLGPVPGILNSGFTAALQETTNQLLLVVAPTQPTGTIADVKHVVIFMQENRSFDHYFGSLHGVHGYSDHVTLTLPNGNSDLYQPSGSSYELPFHTGIECLSDLDHSWSATHEAWNSGNWNQWPAAKSTETMAFYNRTDLAYYYALADNFTICDEYHCSVMSSTDPNRVSFWTGMIDPNDLGGGPLIDNTEPANGWGTNWVTYPELLQKAGVTWKVFQASDNYDDNALYWFAAYKDAPAGSPLAVNGTTFAPNIQGGTGFGADYTNLVAEFKGAVISNTLPSVSWIIGPDVGSEHPSWSPEDGEILTKGLLDALASNPQVYNSTVFILNYDENDGFYDHAVPINPPAGTTNEFVSGMPIGLGVRVPCIIISPWSAGGYACSQVFDHTSVLRFLEKWTGVQEPNISAWRRQVCGDLTSAFDFTHVNTNYPSLLVTAENDCASGSTASPPSSQTVPAQEAGTLQERPLPYQPNALAVLDSVGGNCNIVMTNSGAASVHFSVYANAYSSILPTPFDVNSSNTITGSFNTSAGAGNYDFSCYGPNGFLRRFAGNLTNDCGQIDSIAYLNPITDGFEITLANPGSSAVVFSVTNGWFANSLSTYAVPANSTNIMFLDASTNNGCYDLTVTASSDPLFVRRFAGHIETSVAPAGLVSSENPSGFRDNVTFTAAFAGFGIPTGTAQFLTNGIVMGAPVILTNGVACISTPSLPRANNLVTVAYSGDLLNSSSTNNLTQVVLNHPPVPAMVVYQRAASLPLNILISDLLTNVTDADGDPIALIGVGTDGLNLMTTNGASLATNNNYISYSNSVTPNVNDSFEYTVSDGQGGISLGTILIVVNTNYIAQTNVSLVVSTTNAIVNFFGVPGTQYEVDRSTNLTPGLGMGWISISTNMAPANGIIQINDNFQNLGIQVPPTPPSAYYRLRPNP